MSLNFSAMQYERSFRARSLSNWEYQRFFPPRPRNLLKNSTAICEKNGHLLPSAKREGHFLGEYRGTYHLPLRITRSFANLYNRCLSGQHKYAKYPRDLCCCQKKTEKNKCGWRETLGQKGDPLWEKPQCQTKCEGLQQLLDIDELHRRCKHAKCEPKPKEKLIPRVGDSSMRNRKRLRKRPVTAFDYNRSRNTGTHLEEHAQALAEKNKGNPPPPSKDTASSPSKDTASATASKSNSKQK
ncbi:hypothetical protein ACLKA7_006927 [Drosophila subpalustris]